VANGRELSVEIKFRELDARTGIFRIFTDSEKHCAHTTSQPQLKHRDMLPSSNTLFIALFWYCKVSSKNVSKSLECWAVIRKNRVSSLCAAGRWFDNGLTAVSKPVLFDHSPYIVCVFRKRHSKPSVP